jgi:hypothetical protein
MLEIPEVKDIVDRLIAQANLPETVTLLAGFAIVTDGMQETYLTLPKDFIEDQRTLFIDELVASDLVCSSVFWLSNGGILEFDAEADDWHFHPAIPAIPAYPNTGTGADVVNNPHAILAGMQLVEQDTFGGVDPNTTLEEASGVRNNHTPLDPKA